MTDKAIVADNIGVRYRPYVEKQPTLRRSLTTLQRRRSEAVVALDGVSFDVDKGEAFGIVGHNGAGKSTLLRVLAGTLYPDTGVVNIQGRTSTLLALGVGFNMELTGRRNVYLGGLAAGATRKHIDEVFDDIVAYAELASAIDRPVKTYSSGMFARLAFSVGMYLQPEVLLLDEVLAVGDEAFRQKSMESMRDLLDRAGTIVFVSHSLSKISEFCDRVLWLNAGRVQALGPAADVVSEYRSFARQAAVTAGTIDVRPVPPRGWPWRRKMQLVIRMLRGEDLGMLATEFSVTPNDIETWRQVFFDGGREALIAMDEQPKRGDLQDASSSLGFGEDTVKR